MKLEGKKVLITGATGGIGKSLAYALSKKGAQVVLHGRCREKLDMLATDLWEQGHEVHLLAADIKIGDERRKLVEEVSQIGIDILINNAAVNQFSLFEQMSEDQIESILYTNINATMLLTHDLLPTLQQAGAAMVVNVGSTFGSIGFPGYAVYCATKHALKGFSDALRREMADTAVKVIYVAPRATSTSMNTSAANSLNTVLGIRSDHPYQVAGAIIRSMEKDTARSQIGWPEKFQVKINNLLPQVVDLALFKQLPVIKQYTQTNP